MVILEEYPNYAVTRDGEVYSIRDIKITPYKDGVKNVNHIKTIIPRVKKLKITKFNSTGYCRVSLSNENGQKSVSVHRLVAMAFIPNPKKLPCVNHKDGDKTNNKADNLEWVTYSDNTKHAYKIGLHHGRKGETHPMAKLSLSDVQSIKTMYENGANLRDIHEKYNQVTMSHLSAIINNKRW